MKKIEVQQPPEKPTSLNVRRAGAALLSGTVLLGGGALAINKAPVSPEDIPRPQTAEQKVAIAEDVSSYLEALEDQGAAEVVVGNIPEGGGFLDAVASATTTFENMNAEDKVFIPFGQSELFSGDGSERSDIGLNVAMELAHTSNPVLQPGEFPGGVAIDVAFAEHEVEHIANLLDRTE